MTPQPLVFPGAIARRYRSGLDTSHHSSTTLTGYFVLGGNAVASRSHGRSLHAGFWGAGISARRGANPSFFRHITMGKWLKPEKWADILVFVTNARFAREEV